MAYVPGFRHDVFVSYAHGDDRAWINQFVQRLKEATKARLGVEPSFFIDSEDLRRSRDFSMEIPDSVQASATVLLLPSPTYLNSEYCVEVECRIWTETLAAKREKFKSVEFRNELFAFRSLILPVDENAHWKLITGATDYSFCDKSWTLSQDTPAFQNEFRRLLDDLVEMLKRMRNHATSVFLYPPSPSAEIQDAHHALSEELSAQSYRILPDTRVDVSGQLLDSVMSVFILGKDEDTKLPALIEAARQQPKPWVVWRSPAAAASMNIAQRGFCKFLEQVESDNKTYLNEKVSVPKLKEQVLITLRPEAQALPPSDGKRRVYIIFDTQAPDEIDNVGLIHYHYRDWFHFEFSSDPRQHSKWLSQSDGVLLVWGKTGEEWCSQEFEKMQSLARSAKSKGICLFDPKEAKKTAIDLIRNQARDLYVSEQFESFDPRRLAPFFERLQ